VIPESAVDAAARADYGDGWDRASEWERSAYLDHSKLLLEAAAPHMLEEAKADAWDEGKNVRRCDGVPPNPYRSQE